MIAADLVVMLNSSSWTDVNAAQNSGTYGLPAHKQGGGLPAGSDELLADGSAAWVRSSRLLNLYSANGANHYDMYFYQDDLGGLAQNSANLKHGP
jgi:hypothetical protein